MGIFKSYLNQTIYLWNDGYVIEAILRIMIPVLLISTVFWLLSVVVSFVFKILLPVFIVFLIVSYVSEK
ncbi:hypothetical protein M2475_000397 [Breznakia sp. PF5-3]|uniref:hypothetical protein n=1 Tax=unclassified Breznakia TaxID=2623764 RepID=UPI00240636F6|nr:MULTISPECIES: hypothetical protein [unclassified Breznakia]MDF9824089.1 hypothetical protein [Breznakia sp. PM6-1]MDF9834845.1 hypothetical protein [Breznakia sp. PF5-3]MDF9837133.1 hypothetical protein [Breznakia sp. PFB2-8]MDF9859058.1 hypothetical protein [Breznakia sp. PH5-24]